MANTAFEWFLKEDLTPYKGKWIVYNETGLVAAGEDLQKAIAEFHKRFSDQTPHVFKVPKSVGLMVLWPHLITKG